MHDFMENTENKLPHSTYGTIPPNPSASPNPNLLKESEQKPLNSYQLQLNQHFDQYGLWSLAVGLLAAFCFYKNPGAVT